MGKTQHSLNPVVASFVPGKASHPSSQGNIHETESSARDWRPILKDEAGHSTERKEDRAENHERAAGGYAGSEELEPSEDKGVDNHDLRTDSETTLNTTAKEFVPGQWWQLAPGTWWQTEAVVAEQEHQEPQELQRDEVQTGASQHEQPHQNAGQYGITAAESESAEAECATQRKAIPNSTNSVETGSRQAPVDLVVVDCNPALVEAPSPSTPMSRKMFMGPVAKKTQCKDEENPSAEAALSAGPPPVSQSW